METNLVSYGKTSSRLNLVKWCLNLLRLVYTMPCTVSGETELLSSARVLDDSSQGSSTGNHSAAHIPSQSSQVGLSSV